MNLWFSPGKGPYIVIALKVRICTSDKGNLTAMFKKAEWGSHIHFSLPRS